MLDWLRRFWRPETALFLALWVGLCLAGRSRMVRDPGTFWHTSVGERILTTGEVPRTDPFSYTHGGQPWVASQWLAEVLMALLDRVGGLDLQFLVAVTVVAGLFTWLGLRLMRGGLHWSLSVSLLALALAVSAGHFHVRPLLATLVLFAVMVGWLIDVEAERIPVTRLLWLLPLFVLWTNLHGGMLGGLATLLLAILGWGVWRAVGWPSPFRWWMVPLWVGCALTSLVSPYGLDMPRTWLSIMSMPELKELIVEHRAPRWTDFDTLALLALGGGYFGLLLATLPTRPRVAWGLPLVWLILSLDRVRHMPLFAILVLLVLADLFSSTSLARRLVARGSDLYTPPTEPFPPRAPLWTLGAVVLLVAACLPIPYAVLDPERWPIALLPHLREHEEPGKPIYNSVNDGGFLIRFTPGYRIHQDDRCELYGGKWLTEQLQATPVDGPFSIALVERGSPMHAALSARPEDWHEVDRTSTRVLYVRTSEAR